MVLDSDTLLIIEWIAATLGVINIGLLIFRSVWNFPFGIAMVALYIFVFFEERLYAEAGLQVFFILAQLWGWWLWLKVGGENDRVPVRWLDWMSRAVWVMVTAAVSVNLGWAMHELTNAVLPYADAGIAGASVAFSPPPPSRNSVQALRPSAPTNWSRKGSIWPTGSDSRRWPPPTAVRSTT